MPVFNFYLVDATSNTDLGGQEYDDAVQATEVADEKGLRGKNPTFSSAAAGPSL